MFSYQCVYSLYFKTVLRLLTMNLANTFVPFSVFIFLLFIMNVDIQTLSFQLGKSINYYLCKFFYVRKSGRTLIYSRLSRAWIDPSGEHIIFHTSGPRDGSWVSTCSKMTQWESISGYGGTVGRQVFPLFLSLSLCWGASLGGMEMWTCSSLSCYH